LATRLNRLLSGIPAAISKPSSMFYSRGWLF
jgi:hypothetical protein